MMSDDADILRGMDNTGADSEHPDYAALAREHAAACDVAGCERQRSVHLMEEAWMLSAQGMASSRREYSPIAIATTEQALERIRLAVNCLHAEPQASQDTVYLLDNLLTHLLASDEPGHVAEAVSRSSELVELQAEKFVERMRKFGRDHPATVESLEVLNDLVTRRARARERAGLNDPAG